MALNWRTVLRAFSIFKKDDQSTHTAAIDAIEVPNSWLIDGMIPITIGLVVGGRFEAAKAVGYIVAQLVGAMIAAGQRLGLETIEAGWVLDNNTQVSRMLRSVGFRRCRVYGIYAKPLL